MENVICQTIQVQSYLLLDKFQCVKKVKFTRKTKKLFIKEDYIKPISIVTAVHLDKLGGNFYYHRTQTNVNSLLIKIHKTRIKLGIVPPIT